MLDNEAYTVGWICALHVEYVAARLFLDDIHVGPQDRSDVDNNTYTLGRVGSHNIVIASLPEGEYGLCSAAIVASDMQHTFRNVRIGLMVGIGGGAPSSKHDIRLGDVVVSSMVNGKACVLQYDFGKRIQGKEFQQTGYLNQPPRLLRSALGQLRAKHEEDGHTIEETIEAILKKKPRLKKYRRPDPKSDILCKSDFLHKNANERCSICCDPSSFITRREREEDEDNLAIHYGRIASANSLMRDASQRDRIGQDEEILCFEMEAAGLMNHFPCLVIRGICDYSDSHKNDLWQGYAAMAAAAFAKELLLEISPSDVSKQKKIIEVLSEVENNIKAIAKDVEYVVHRQNDEETLKILNWVSPIDHVSEQTHNFKRREEGTCNWFLQAEGFRKWQEGPNQKLFCTGIPGAGKTTVTSVVVNHLKRHFQEDKEVGVAYIYFNFKQAYDIEASAASILKQLSESRPSIVKKLYETHQKTNSKPSQAELWKAIKDISGLYSRIFIALDALDESALGNNIGIFLNAVSNNKTKLGINLFATSRPITNIESIFVDSYQIEIRATREDVEQYLTHHLSILPDFVTKSQLLRDSVMDRILSSIDGMFLLAYFYLQALVGVPSRKALDVALENFAQITNGYDFAYKTAMERINSQSLFSRDLAKRVLLWVSRTQKPLEMRELKEALAVEIGTSTFSKDNIPETDLVSICAGLITAEGNDDQAIIRLVHYTAQSYFEETWKAWFPEAEEYIASVCITYLSYGSSKIVYAADCHCDLCDDVQANAKHCYCFQCNFIRGKEQPLTYYASNYWAYHAQVSGIDGKDIVLNFLRNPSIREYCCVVTGNSLDFQRLSREPSMMSGLGYAAYLGLDHSVAALITETRESMNHKDDWGRTPISWAAVQGHASTINLLLESGARFELPDKDLETPLDLASRYGHPEIVERLFQQGASIEFERRSRRTPLELATQCGRDTTVRKILSLISQGNPVNVDLGRLLETAIDLEKEEVAKILIDFKADTKPNIIAYDIMKALSTAASRNAESIFQLLLDKLVGADPNSEFGYLHELLYLAAESGQRKITKMILDKSIEYNFNGGPGNRPPISLSSNSNHRITPFQVAVAAEYANRPGLQWKISHYDIRTRMSIFLKDKEAIITLFLEDVSKSMWHPRQIENGESFIDSSYILKAAVKYGFLGLVSMFLERGADSIAQDVKLSELLEDASQNGQVEVMLLLLDKGRFKDLRDDSCSRALGYAIQNGHEAVVRLMLERGANVNGLDSQQRTPLLSVAEHGCEILGRLLIDKGANLDFKDLDGVSALQLSAAHGRIGFMQLLLERGVDIEIRDHKGKTPIFAAATHGNKEAIRLLLDHGADINAISNKGKTPIFAAVAAGCNEEGLRFFMAHGADFNARSDKGKTLIFATAACGNEEALRFLIYHGADINTSDIYGRTPLHIAVEKGQVVFIKVLLGLGADMHARNQHGDTPLLLAATREKKRDQIELLINFETDLDLSNKAGETVLHLIAITCKSFHTRKRRFDVAKLAMSRGASLNAKTLDGSTPFYHAIRSGDQGMVRCLLECGADPTVRDIENRTSLHIAAACNNYRATRRLLHIGLGVEEIDNYGETPLHYAARRIVGHDQEEKTELEQLLINTGACLETANNRGETALHCAVLANRYRMVKLLLKRGANIEARTKHGQTPLMMASATYENGTKVQLFLKTKNLTKELGVFPEKNEMFPALWWRCGIPRYPRVLTKLLDKKANKNAEDTWYNTSLSLGFKNQDRALVWYLLGYGAQIIVSPQKFFIQQSRINSRYPREPAQPEVTFKVDQRQVYQEELRWRAYNLMSSASPLSVDPVVDWKSLGWWPEIENLGPKWNTVD